MTTSPAELAREAEEASKAEATVAMLKLFGPYWDCIHIVYGGVKDDGFAVRVRDAMAAQFAALALSFWERAEAGMCERAAGVADKYAAEMTAAAHTRDEHGKPSTVAHSKADAGETLAAVIRALSASTDTMETGE